MLKNHVLPVFGRELVTDIDQQMVRQFLLKKIGDGKATSTVTHLNNTISGVLNEAVLEKVIPANPAHRIGKLGRKQRMAPNVDPPFDQEGTGSPPRGLPGPLPGPLSYGPDPCPCDGMSGGRCGISLISGRPLIGDDHSVFADFMALASIWSLSSLLETFLSWSAGLNLTSWPLSALKISSGPYSPKAHNPM